jgi:hypothetical protein
MICNATIKMTINLVGENLRFAQMNMKELAACNISKCVKDLGKKCNPVWFVKSRKPLKKEVNFHTFLLS